MSAAPIVLYIGGLDRSGSTLLANIFDAIDGCISIGEFHTFWKQGFQENWRSSDGHAFHDSPFWQQVLTAFGESYGDYDPAECARITDDVQSRRHKLPFQLGVLGNTAAMTDADRDYARIFHHLYLAISKVSGDRILVDSGKQAYHPFVCAAGSPETDLRIAHLIRDSRAVAYSRQRVKPNLNVTSGPTEMARFSPQYMSARWLWQNGLLGFSKKRVRAYTRVLYTELTRQPMQEFDRMVQALELPIPAEDYTFLANRTFMTKPGVAFSGNPHRFDFKETKIRPDDAWRSEMKTSSRTLVTAMTWPMLRYYGM